MSDVRSLILISDVWCHISNVRRLMFCCQTSNVRCQSSDVWCPMSDVWFLMFDVWCQMYDVWCEMSDFWSLMSNVCEFWFLMSNIWCPMSRVRSLMYDVCCLISDVRSVRCLMSDVSEGSSYRRSTAYGPSDYMTIVWNQRSFGTDDHSVRVIIMCGHLRSQR